MLQKNWFWSKFCDIVSKKFDIEDLNEVLEALNQMVNKNIEFFYLIYNFFGRLGCLTSSFSCTGYQTVSVI